MVDQRTPGPWTVTESDPAEGAHVFWITAPQGCGPNNGEVDIVSVHGNKAANARLIAAAPEMLEALRLYDRTYASTQTHPTVADEAACIAAVRAAIAKATGGK